MVRKSSKQTWYTKFSLVGHSQGCLVALEYANRYS